MVSSKNGWEKLHLVLKMGRENYMFGLTVGALRAALWLNFFGEKRKKNLWDQRRDQGTSEEGKLHILVRK